MMGGRPEISDALRAVMAEIGPRWRADTSGHVKLMVEQFSKLLATAPPDGLSVRMDVAYGEHERQRFDIYAPTAPGQNRPAVLFVHGGAFIDGHRNRTGQIYSNVTRYFARHGLVGINIGYRLADVVQYPGATRDIAAVVAWTRENAGELGIDPSRIFLMGHSAGGAHVASYAYDKRLHPADGPGLAGLIVLSGRVRADNRPDNPNARKVEAYYGADSARYDDVSPVMHVSADSLPTFVAWSEFENPLIDVYCAELTWRLGQAKGRTPPILWLKGHNHTSTIGHIGTADDALGTAMRAFIDNPR
jgi:acetyl esterase